MMFTNRARAHVYVAFEIGPTLAGLESGLALTRFAAEADGQAIKWQVFQAERLVGRDVPVSFGALGGPMTRSMLEILQRRALRNVEWYEMAQEAKAQGLDIIATVDYPETLKLACDIGATALKVMSADITHLDWIGEMARAGLPVMLDTGSAGLGEIEQAVEACLRAGQSDIVVVHCPSGYPAGTDSINLRMLTTLRHVFGDVATIGFSDHSPGADMDVAAIALGARYIEKTLCLNCAEPWPEHTMAVEPAEAVTFVRRLRDVEAAMGSPRRTLTPAETAAKGNARRGAFARVRLETGEYPIPSLIEWRRPAAGGIEPPAWPFFASLPLRQPVAAGQQITAQHFA